MDKDKILINDQIKGLSDKILYHKALYYRGEPEISDLEYDKLEEKLRELDSENPVLFLVGSNTASGSVNHNPPMLSCRKAIGGIAEVYSWFEKLIDKALICSYKVDGLSLSLQYENGYLSMASTRGDGQKGENVTVNIMKVETIPKTIPYNEKINIRGELFMKKSEFQRLKQIMPEMYSSPRNLATGTIKQKNPLESANRKLHFMVFEIIGLDEFKYTSEQFSHISSWGFETVVIKKFSNPSHDDILSVYNDLQEQRDSLDFEIDGIVYRNDNRKEFYEAGTTAHSPRGQIALKFENQGTETKLLQITWQVSRNGILTPVAELEPVLVAGATISRATMHNYDFLKLNDISIGDIVIVERAGDVIPKIIGVAEKLGSKYNPPMNCPSCNTLLTTNNVTLVCPNLSCPARLKQIINHWIKVVDIKGLGEKNIDKLISNGLLSNVGDLYSPKLSEKTLVSLLGKNGEKIYQEIQNKKSLPFNLFLTGLGIDSVGKTTAKVLAKHFPNLKDLQNATKYDLLQIEGISDISADKILSGIRDNNLIENLLKNGVTIGEFKTKIKTKTNKTLNDFLGIQNKQIKTEPSKAKEKITPSTNENNKQEDFIVSQEKKIISKGKIYVTGSVPFMTKEQIQEFVEEKGYEWSTSISGKLDYLILGDKPGKAKIDKAIKLGVKVISWEKLLRLQD
jgi:DNA ligase (NAD+)